MSSFLPPPPVVIAPVQPSRHAGAPLAPPGAPGTFIRFAAIALASAAASSIWFGAPLAPDARIVLIVFSLATIGWTMTAIDDTLIALAAAAALVATRTVPTEQLHLALGSELIWLLIGSFVIAAALRASGLAERLALSALQPFSRVSSLFFAVTFVIIATAFLVPSTSGRAALLLPVYLALAEAIDDRRINRALALLFPSVILLSAGGSLIGAGAHLIAVEMMTRAGRPGLDYLDWIVLGLPFAVLCSLAATIAILTLFLSRAERSCSLERRSPERTPLTRPQIHVLAVAVTVMIGWSTQSWHGIDIAIVTLLGAVAVTLQPLAPVSMKQAVKATEWQLILFLAATTLMGGALIETGAAGAIVKGLLGLLPGEALTTPWLLVEVICAIALLSHLVITSRSARAAVLIPMLALPFAAQGYDLRALAFVIVMGTGFCQTLPVSAKPVALFAGLDRPTYQPRDLVLLSAVLLPLIFALLMGFATYIWPLMGLPLLR